MARLMVLAVAGLLVTGKVASAQAVRSGFNDVSGINSDGIANASPFDVNNATLSGQGVGEPGWAGPWIDTEQPSLVVPSGFEGDGAAFFQGTRAANRTLSQPLSGLVSVEVRVKVQSATISGNGINFYVLGPSGSTNPITQYGPQWQLRSNGKFAVVDGIENSADSADSLVEYTPFSWTPGVWHRVRIDINTATRTWDFYVDGMRYNSPDPLGYRGVPTQLDTIRYLNEIGGPNGSYLDAVVVQPAASQYAIAGRNLTQLAIPYSYAGYRATNNYFAQQAYIYNYYAFNYANLAIDELTGAERTQAYYSAYYNAYLGWYCADLAYKQTGNAQCQVARNYLLYAYKYFYFAYAGY